MRPRCTCNSPSRAHLDIGSVRSEMAGLGNAPAATKVATVFIVIAFVVFLVGFGAPYWRKYPLGGHSGLWQSCGLFLGLDGCRYYTDLDELGKDTYRTY